MKRIVSAGLSLLLMLTACGASPGGEAVAVLPAFSDGAHEAAAESPYAVFEGPTAREYIERVVQNTLDRIITPDMGDYEKVKAVYDYLIEIGYYSLPVGLDTWRIHAVAEERLPSFTENRALSMLLYGIGACEDYACAFIMLCSGMGIEARYMPGLTYEADGEITHHAWNQVRVDGIWYNLDAELEDGISDGTVHYRYFLKSDATMRLSHFWGQELIEMGRLGESQHMAIAGRYMGETCPQDYPTPAPSAIPVTPAPDEAAILAGLRAEFDAFEATYGPLSYVELRVLPPVFGETGGYWSYWTAPAGMEDWIYQIVVDKFILTPREGSYRRFAERRAAAATRGAPEAATTIHGPHDAERLKWTHNKK